VYFVNIRVFMSSNYDQTIKIRKPKLDIIYDSL